MLWLCEGTLSLGTGVAVMSCHMGAGNWSQVLCITEVGPTFGHIPRTMVYHESLVQIKCLSSVLLGVMRCVEIWVCLNKMDGRGLGECPQGLQSGQVVSLHGPIRSRPIVLHGICWMWEKLRLCMAILMVGSGPERSWATGQRASDGICPPMT